MTTYAADWGQVRRVCYCWYPANAGRHQPLNCIKWAPIHTLDDHCLTLTRHSRPSYNAPAPAPSYNGGGGDNGGGGKGGLLNFKMIQGFNSIDIYFVPKTVAEPVPSYFWILQCVVYFMAVRLSQISDNATFLSSFVRRQILLNTIAKGFCHRKIIRAVWNDASPFQLKLSYPMRSYHNIHIFISWIFCLSHPTNGG